MEYSKDAFDTNCTWDELRRKYVEERRFWNEGGPEPFKVVNTEVEGPIGLVPVRIYYPDDKANNNALVFIHGGANLALGTNLYLRDVFGGNDYITMLFLAPIVIYFNVLSAKAYEFFFLEVE